MTTPKPMQTIKINELLKGFIYTKSLTLSDREAFVVLEVKDKNLIVQSRKTGEEKSIRKTAKFCIFLRSI